MLVNDFVRTTEGVNFSIEAENATTIQYVLPLTFTHNAPFLPSIRQYSNRVTLSPSFPTTTPSAECLHPFSQPQLQNKGEQGDKTYAEAVPWLEMAGGFLTKYEVI